MVNFENLRAQLLQSGTYMGDPTLLEHVHWTSDGRRDVLVRNAEANNANNDQQPTGPALLSTVTRISDQFYWLYSDGGWKGPTEFTTFLYQVKASCMGVRPNDEAGEFQTDFVVVGNNAHALQDLAATPEFEIRAGFVSHAMGQAAQIKFRHNLFQEIHGGESERELQGTTHLSEWPVHSDPARSALLDMMDTHRAIPLAAYDAEENLIPPNTYQRHLQGALVEIHFQLTHCAFKKKDTFTADIDTIRVLRAPPPPIVPVNTKRKLPPKFESPTSRRRLA